MRDFKGMKRQRGRNRGPGGGGNNGGKQQHNANRAFDSNGPEGIKVRDAAQGVYEKYQQLARDAATGGDRVLAENYLQHAEHYYRVLRTMQPQRPVSEIIGRDASGFDIDFEAEPEFVAEAPAEAEGDAAQAEGEGGQPREERQREDRPRFNDRPREERQRDDRPRYNDRQRDDRSRDDRPREDRQRDDRPRYNNDRPRDERSRDDRPREDRPREDRPRDERPREERAPRRERSDFAAEAPATEAPPPRDGARLRGQDGAVSEAPAFLSRGAAPAAQAPAPVAEEAPKKRGRPRKAAAPVEDA